MRYYMSDGYFPNGKNRPKREVLVIEKTGCTSLVEYVDDKSQLYVSNLRIEEREEAKN